jgi:hypothetical protein
MPRGRGGKIERREVSEARAFDRVFGILAGSGPCNSTWCDKIAERDRVERNKIMCRNIKTLFNFEPPATDAEVRASALQFVRKLSGFNKPSKANEEAFNRAVVEVTAAAARLIFSLETTGEPRNREVEAEKAKERAKARFGPM